MFPDEDDKKFAESLAAKLVLLEQSRTNSEERSLNDSRSIHVVDIFDPTFVPQRYKAINILTHLGSALEELNSPSLALEAYILAGESVDDEKLKKLERRSEKESEDRRKGKNNQVLLSSRFPSRRVELSSSRVKIFNKGDQGYYRNDDLRSLCGDVKQAIKKRDLATLREGLPKLEKKYQYWVKKLIESMHAESHKFDGYRGRVCFSIDDDKIMCEYKPEWLHHHMANSYSASPESRKEMLEIERMRYQHLWSRQLPGLSEADELRSGDLQSKKLLDWVVENDPTGEVVGSLVSAISSLTPLSYKKGYDWWDFSICPEKCLEIPRECNTHEYLTSEQRKKLLDRAEIALSNFDFNSAIGLYKVGGCKPFKMSALGDYAVDHGFPLLALKAYLHAEDVQGCTRLAETYLNKGDKLSAKNIEKIALSEEIEIRKALLTNAEKEKMMDDITTLREDLDTSVARLSASLSSLWWDYLGMDAYLAEQEARNELEPDRKWTEYERRTFGNLDYYQFERVIAARRQSRVKC